MGSNGAVPKPDEKNMEEKVQVTEKEEEKVRKEMEKNCVKRQ